PALVARGPQRPRIQLHGEGLGEIFSRVALRVPMIEMLHKALAVGLRRVVLGVWRGREAEQPAPRGPAPQLIRVVDRVTGLVTQDSQARFKIAAFDLEHLGELEPRQPRMREIEGDGDARHAVRREPLVGQPVMRTEPEAPRLELPIEVRDALLEVGAFDGYSEITE